MRGAVKLALEGGDRELARGVYRIDSDKCAMARVTGPSMG